MTLVRHLHTVHALLHGLAQPTPERHTLRALLTVAGRVPTRRTWERRLRSLNCRLKTTCYPANPPPLPHNPQYRTRMPRPVSGFHRRVRPASEYAVLPW